MLNPNAPVFIPSCVKEKQLEAHVEHLKGMNYAISQESKLLHDKLRDLEETVGRLHYENVALRNKTKDYHILEEEIILLKDQIYAVKMENRYLKEEEIATLKNQKEALKIELSILKEEAPKKKEETEKIFSNIVSQLFKEEDKNKALEEEIHQLRLSRPLTNPFDDEELEKLRADLKNEKANSAKKTEEVKSLMEILYNATQDFMRERMQLNEEKAILQDTMNSIAHTYQQKNGESEQYRNILEAYERRIAEIQTYNGIESRIYFPQIMNPEDEYD